MAKPILYSYYRSSASYRVRCALYLKGVDFEYRPVNIIADGGDQFKPEFKKLNPMAQVPCYVDGTVTLSESIAIIQYLDSQFKTNHLFSKDPKAWAPILQVCEFINAGIQPYQNTLVLKKLGTDFGVSEEQKIKWVQFFNERGLGSVEAVVKGTAGKYAFGDSVTAADCFIVPQLYAANRFKVDLGKFPTLKRISDNCNDLEAFKKAHPDRQPDTPKT